MNPTLLALLGVIDLGVAAQFLYAGKFWSAFIWFAYALAQAGWVMESK